MTYTPAEVFTIPSHFSIKGFKKLAYHVRTLGRKKNSQNVKKMDTTKTWYPLLTAEKITFWIWPQQEVKKVLKRGDFNAFNKIRNRYRSGDFNAIQNWFRPFYLFWFLVIFNIKWIKIQLKQLWTLLKWHDKKA